MYYLIYGLLYLLSLLPWFIMYGISDFLAFLVWNVIGYRRDVVLGNLRIAFPEKSETEREQIARAFYRQFTDTLVESVKVISMGEKGLSKKFVSNQSLVEQLPALGSRVHLHAMHNFNWEILNLGTARDLPMPFMGVYMPLRNKHLERIFRKVRSRTGTILIPATEFKTDFRKYDQSTYTLALVADQNPGSPAHAYWLNFFSRPAPFVRGPERAARSRQLAVVFANFFPVRRGVYTLEFKVATKDASTLPEGELTRMYVRYLEECIRERPANYLWSHRRWKHDWKPEYETSTLETLRT